MIALYIIIAIVVVYFLFKRSTGVNSTVINQFIKKISKMGYHRPTGQVSFNG